MIVFKSISESRQKGRIKLFGAFHIVSTNGDIGNH